MANPRSFKAALKMKLCYDVVVRFDHLPQMSGVGDGDRSTREFRHAALVLLPACCPTQFYLFRLRQP